MFPCPLVRISQARTIAFDVLRRVETQSAFADEVLRAELGSNARTEDAGLATELTLGVLRWQRLFGHLPTLVSGARAGSCRSPRIR